MTEIARDKCEKELEGHSKLITLLGVCMDEAEANWRFVALATIIKVALATFS